MKKIFITGASGFVGTHLVEAAKNKKLEVHAAVRPSSNTDDIKPFVDKFVYPDFTDVAGLRSLFEAEQYAYVIHAAAMTKAKTETDMETVNVGYTENLLEAAFSAQIPIEQFVYVSSLAAIGPISYDSDQLINEESPYQPLTVYGRSKQKSELMIKRRFADKPISVFRPTAVYGPREKDLFIIFDTMNKGLDPYIGKTPQKLSFIYVKDLVSILLQSLFVANEHLNFYNLTDGQIYSKYALADVFRKTFGGRMLRLHIPLSLVRFIAQLSQQLYRNSAKTPVIYPERLKELTAENWGCDIAKAKQNLAFDPAYNLEQGLQETLSWYKAQKWLK